MTSNGEGAGVDVWKTEDPVEIDSESGAVADDGTARVKGFELAADEMPD